MHDDDTVNFIYLTEYYGSIVLTLGLTERDGGLNTSQKRVLKTFPGTDCLFSKNGLV